MIRAETEKFGNKAFIWAAFFISSALLTGNICVTMVCTRGLRYLSFIYPCGYYFFSCYQLHYYYKIPTFYFSANIAFVGTFLDLGYLGSYYRLTFITTLCKELGYLNTAGKFV